MQRDSLGRQVAISSSPSASASLSEIQRLLLPEFAIMCSNRDADFVLMHQDAFAPITVVQNWMAGLKK